MMFALPKDVRNSLAVGDIVVPMARPPGSTASTPVLGSSRRLRRHMSDLGVYAGIAYRVIGIAFRPYPDFKQTFRLTSLRSLNPEDWCRVYVTLRPIHRLSREFERQWPIEVAFDDLPLLLTQSMYNTATLLSTLAASGASVATGLVGRTFISLCYIPSHSMEPSIQAGDLVLIEGVTRHFVLPRRGEIVAFKPPDALKELVRAKGETLNDNDYFVKRVACIERDHVMLGHRRLMCQTPEKGLIEPPKVKTHTASLAIASAVGGGRSLTAPQDLSVPDGMAFVVGDNPSVSVDSRVWGCVPRANIVGRPFFRLLPLERFGPIE